MTTEAQMMTDSKLDAVSTLLMPIESFCQKLAPLAGNALETDEDVTESLAQMKALVHSIVQCITSVERLTGVFPNERTGSPHLALVAASLGEGAKASGEKSAEAPIARKA